MLRLGWSTSTRDTYAGSLTYATDKDDLLVVADAIVQLHPGWLNQLEHTELHLNAASLARFIGELEMILRDGGSELHVDIGTRRLVYRVDETATAAANKAADDATPDARDHLRTAWGEAYGMAPDPDAAYREAVRAVEAAVCPLVQPAAAAAGKSTLGTVIGELGRNAPHKWEFVIPNSSGQPQDVSRLVGMLEMLWQGQVSRHAGGTQNRRQTQAEAEAAVHLAATLVQWLSTGALRPVT
jgi:hypothetical protein